jgi:deazaflavin-dependent oxidoreductase (nitroreductase family)
VDDHGLAVEDVGNQAKGQSMSHEPVYENKTPVTEAPHKVELPWWLKPSNRVVIALQRVGVVIGTMRLLSVPGRKSGKLRTTPVSPLVVGGRLYIVGGFPQADWVKNVRTAGWGILGRGRKQERVTLTELPQEDRSPILQQFPREVPHGVQFFVQAGVVESPDPEAFAAAAPRCTVFRVEE